MGTRAQQVWAPVFTQSKFYSTSRSGTPGHVHSLHEYRAGRWRSREGALCGLALPSGYSGPCPPGLQNWPPWTPRSPVPCWNVSSPDMAEWIKGRKPGGHCSLWTGASGFSREARMAGGGGALHCSGAKNISLHTCVQVTPASRACSSGLWMTGAHDPYGL